MARTFNRNPLQVNVPNSNDVKNYFFNHYNWKGINTDKNFLTVDQETFADAKNVYVDAEGLLKSRPAIKRKSMYSNSVFDFWSFDDVDVYGRIDKYNRYLVFVKNGQSYELSIGGGNDPVNLVKIGKKIFSFVGYHFNYFDTEELKIGNGYEYIYIPNTVVDATGVETNIESKNVLTSREKYTYIYNREIGISMDAYGKSLDVEIDGKDYSVVFEHDTPEVLTDVLFTIPETYDDVIVSNKNTYAFFSSAERKISFSASGKILSKTFILDNDFGDIISLPRFSQDSNYIMIATTQSIYIVSVISDTSSGLPMFQDFTDVKNYIKDFKWFSVDVVDADFDFETYDSFAYFVSNYNEVNDEYMTIIGCNRNDKSLSTFNYVYKNGRGLKIYHSSNYRHSDKNGALLFNGLVFYVSSNRDSLSIHLMEDLLSAEVVSERNLDSEVMDVKIFENKIIFLENQLDTSWYQVLTQNPLSYDFDETLFIGEMYGYSNALTNNHLLSTDASKVFYENRVYFVNEKHRYIIADDTVNRIIAYNDFVYYADKDNKVFSSLIEGNLHFHFETYDDGTSFKFGRIERLNNLYVWSSNVLHISEYRENNGEFYFYLPEINKQTFDKNITGLHPISTSEMGLFFENEIWYVSKLDNVYGYTKSKLQLGIKDNSDIITSYDGSRVIFPTERGLVALSYQDFVASTDQIVMVLSDPIYSLMKEYCKEPVKMFRYDFWIFLYKNTTSDIFILDTRNNSWWFWTCLSGINKIVRHKNETLFISADRNFYRLDESNEEYYDYDVEKHSIDWYLISQKLHLSQLNNYKHIVNMTFNSMIDTEDYLSFFLDIKNYREKADSGKIENPHYSVDVLRTFVQRLNYFKVNEFQYTLRSDNENKFPLPLSLSSISIKYKKQGQVR